MNRGADIRNWIDNGAEVHEGLRLLAKYAPNPIVERVVVANPALGHLLITALAKYAAPRQQEHQDESPLPTAQKSFREDFPFLAEHTCPIELKALAADKITAYYKYVDAVMERIKVREDELVEMTHEQMNRIQHDKENIDLALLYLNIIQESSEIVTEMRHLLRSEAKFNE